MKKIQFIALNVTILSMVTFSSVNGQSTANDKGSVRVFVQKFYDWYSVLYNADIPGKKTQLSSQEIAMKHEREFFSAALQKALTNYYNTPLKNDDIGLDFDPFIAGQDSGPGYETGNVKQEGIKFFVDVHSIKKGESRKAVLAAELIVIAEVTKENGHWAIANFTYVDNGSKYDLLAMLKKQAKG